MIVIIDTGVANRYSIHNAFSYIGCDVIVSSKPKDIEQADKLVFPGVGAFALGMQSLKDRNLIPVLNEQVLVHHKPILGICLGFQMMAEASQEDGPCAGLGWVPGEVQGLSPEDPKLKVPHVGFNTVRPRGQSVLLGKTQTETDFYFVHSYHLVTDPDIVAGTASYGNEIVAIIEHENIYGVQFHPEKSQSSGLDLLRRFSEVS